jgi:uncharacterized protein YkwD
MKLNKDGTAELTVAGSHIHLPNPTWGQLKKMKTRAQEINEQLATIGESIGEKLTEEQRKGYQATVTGIRSGETTTQAVEALQDLEQEDLDAITEAINQLRTISETSQELSALWWQTTIKELADTDVKSEDLPASLPFQATIENYLGHVQSVPFDFSQ